MSNDLKIDQKTRYERGLQYNFYLNREFISDVLDCDTSQIYPVHNDWQDENALVPELANHLDILPKCPGVFPTESIVQLDKERLGPFFTRLPQYS